MSNYTRVISLSIIFLFMVTGCGEDEPAQTTDAVSPSIPAEETTVLTAPQAEIEEERQIASETVVQAEDRSEPAVQETGTTTEQATESITAGTEQVVEETIPSAGQAASGPVTHTINAEARVFNPDIIYIQPGDTVAWKNMTSHNSVSVEGLIPEGAEHWRGQLGENLKVTLNIEGVYAYVCEPHIGFGMVGVIVVGKPANLEQVKTFASENLEGPYRRLLGKLNKIKSP